MEEDEERDRQLYLDKFLEGNPKLPSPSVRRKKTKRYLIAKAKDRLKECFRLLLESVDRNSVEWSRFRAFFNKVFKEMEIEGVCYFKEMPNGKVRIFKELYCCETVEKWKKCPKYRCPILPGDDGEECPQYPREHEPIEAITIIYQEPEQKEDQPVESV